MASYGYHDNSELFRGSDLGPQEEVCDTDLFPFRTSCQQSDQSLRDPRTFSNDGRMINELVSPKFENEQRTDKGGNAVSDDIAVGHFPLIRRLSVGRAKEASQQERVNIPMMVGPWLHAKLYTRHLSQRINCSNTRYEVLCSIAILLEITANLYVRSKTSKLRIRIRGKCHRQYP